MSWTITPQIKTLDGLISNVVAWWDASDASSFTFSSGNVVQDWRSRIGSYTLTQATSANRPTRSGTVNGLPSVVFDGTNDGLSVANFDLTPGGQKFSMWAVVSAASGSSMALAEHTTNFNNTSGAFSCFRESSNVVSLNKVQGAGNFYSTFQTTGTITTTPKAFLGFHDGTLSTDETSGRLNALTAGTRPLNQNTNANNVNATLYVGARAGTSAFLNGQICELGFTTSVMSNSEISFLESYLSSKWGLGF
jgi:hypothetical protein